MTVWEMRSRAISEPGLSLLFLSKDAVFLIVPMALLQSVEDKRPFASCTSITMDLSSQGMLIRSQAARALLLNSWRALKSANCKSPVNQTLCWIEV